MGGGEEKASLEQPRVQAFALPRPWGNPGAFHTPSVFDSNTKHGIFYWIGPLLNICLSIKDQVKLVWVL